MPVVDYLTIDGEIVSETRNGVVSDYIPDPLGSTAKLVNSTGSVTDEFSYWPYGEVISHAGGNPTPFQYGGTAGFYSLSSASIGYVRARYIQSATTTWITVDPLFPFEPAYLYGYSNPIINIDRTGLGCKTIITNCKEAAQIKCQEKCSMKGGIGFCAHIEINCWTNIPCLGIVGFEIKGDPCLCAGDVQKLGCKGVCNYICGLLSPSQWNPLCEPTCLELCLKATKPPKRRYPPIIKG